MYLNVVVIEGKVRKHFGHFDLGDGVGGLSVMTFVFSGDDGVQFRELS